MEAMADAVFDLRMPAERTSCAIFNSPHSGSAYPPAFLERSRLDPLQIRSSEDAFVDTLFGHAPDFGAPLMAARLSRACVDLNRSAEDLDPALITGASRQFLNPRIAAGLGVIPRVVAEGQPIIEGKIPLVEAQERIAAFYEPYHAQLGALIEESHRMFGMAILFDCHSMPRDALGSAPIVWGRRPNVILGDRFGAACDRWIIESACDIFRAEGFHVARNAPFAGGYITQAYGRPQRGVHALQIEIDRSYYMDEERIEPLASFAQIRDVIGRVVAELAQLGPVPVQVPVAAE